MALDRKFSTSLAFFLVVFMGISLVSIASVIYFMRSKKVWDESLVQFEGRKLELAKILKENLELLQEKIGVLVLDPLLLQSLRSEDPASLSRYVASYDLEINGASLIVHNSRTGQFVPKPSDVLDGLDPYLVWETQKEPENIRFNQLGQDTVTLFSLPVKDMSSEIGTCFLLYDISKDSRFLEIIGSMGIRDPRILFHNGGDELYDIETGSRMSFQREVVVPENPEERSALPNDILSGEVILPLDFFSGMYFGASSQPALEASRSLLKVLASLCLAFFGLVCVASVLLSKMVVKPLEVLADEAIETSRAPTGRFLREERTRYVEFRQIARAFNQVLANLMELQRKYKIKAKKELDASEERYRLTLEAAPDCITINSLVDGRFIQLNEAFVKISGYSREEILGKTNSDLNLFVNPSELERLIAEARQKGGVNGFEAKHRRKDGSIIHSVVSARTVEFEGEPCLISVVSDRTAQKKAEEEQKKLEAALQRATKMEAIGTMAGGVAHDLNNILSGIVSYPELMLMDLPEDSPLRPAVMTIQKSGQRAAAIVQDMLTLARRGVPVTEVVDINNVIQEYLKSPEHKSLLALHPDVRVQADLGKDVMNLVGSDMHIAKSVMNLVSNAFEAMPDGGELRISTRNQYVDRLIRQYDTVKEGDYVILEVSDTGIGISGDDQERIFEPFYTKKKMGRSGTGLGMAVVWGTVKDHNGYIELESRQGVGTTFQLYFPATRSDFVKDKPEIALDQYRGKGESVLVVDDVAQQREIASTVLERLGYKVASVASGEEVLEYLKENAVDLLVLDMVMEPGIDGLETYRRVLEHHPGQRAVIASGFSETDRVREAQLLGAGPYVRKPYLIQNIGMAVRKELDRK
jgi:PAS domain S-box-containing protein